VKKVTIGKLDVLSVFVAWAILLVFFGSLVYSQFFSDIDTNINYIIYIFGAFFIAALCHLTLSYFNRCPHCRKCLTVQGFKPPHPASSGSWNKVVWHWFSGSIACIHCGQKVDTNGL